LQDTRRNCEKEVAKEERAGLKKRTNPNDWAGSSHCSRPTLRELPSAAVGNNTPEPYNLVVVVLDGQLNALLSYLCLQIGESTITSPLPSWSVLHRSLLRASRIETCAGDQARRPHNASSGHLPPAACGRGGAVRGASRAGGDAFVLAGQPSESLDKEDLRSYVNVKNITLRSF
jgi:hypothetical protein